LRRPGQPITMTSNVVLIGMPGAGKSTIGPLLARKLERIFLDTDSLIEIKAGHSLQQILDERGASALKEIEERAILDLVCENCVIATGGSAIYSDAGMRHLARNGLIVYLKVGLTELIRRVGDSATRGILRNPGQTLEDLYRERVPLYERYAHIAVTCEADPAATAAAVLSAMGNSSSR
jgi:shikimate kinase